MLGVLLLFIFAGPALAGEAGQRSDAEPFDHYAEVCGYPIRYVPTRTVAEAAIERDGRKVIRLDPTLSRPEERPRMQFLVAHECGHHRMRHSLPGSRRARLLSTEVVRDQEMSADCFAAELMARLGLERALQIVMQRFYRGGLYSPGGGYPAGIQRAAIIRQCAEEGRRIRMATAEAAP